MISASSRSRCPAPWPTALTAATVSSLVTMAVLAPTADAVSPDTGSATPLDTAVIAATSDGPNPAAIPADFVEIIGYRPAVVDGVLVAPDGACSSPVSLPPEFDTPCKAHDLGYDLLRYAARRGSPLGPWARQTLDQALDQRMHAACATLTDPLPRTRCDTVAEIAATAVELNSRRQEYGVPVEETLVGAATADTPTRPWLWRSAGFVVTAIVAGGVMLWRRRKPTPLVEAPAPAPRELTHI
ncbi:hypothetical protein [Nocardia paucivorans]|uniref:hypothetical protein n=1 Tax=Nocardia paucivorans TaxID=114259 RepID=UPI0002F61C4A|nr:hypothetical protein [Nocardia paucivorans]